MWVGTMPIALENFNPSFDRQDAEKARRLFELLWPSRKVRLACAQRLAKSIRYAHQNGESSWSVTMFNSGIRLNAGQVEVLRLDANDCRIIFHGPIAVRASRRFSVEYKRTAPVYPAVPVPSGVCRFDSKDIESIPNAVWKRHELFIRDAVAAKPTTPHRRSFSDGVLRHLELLLHTSLPRPTYVKNNAHERLHEICIYAIRTLDSLDTEWLAGGSFSFPEGKSWKEAEKQLALAKKRNLNMAILFADAAYDTRAIIYKAVIDGISIGRNATEIRVSNLKKLAVPIQKTDLVIASSGKKISRDHRRSYVVCRTPSGLDLLETALDPIPVTEDLPSATEARRRLVSHFRLERNRALVKRKKLAHQAETGGLACQVCEFDFSKYRSLGVGFCEVHHLKPLSAERAEVLTNLSDLAVVCSNCHRMIHRNGKCRTLSEIKAALNS